MITLKLFLIFVEKDSHYVFISKPINICFISYEF